MANILFSVASRCLWRRNLSSPKKQSQICFHFFAFGGSVCVVRSMVECAEFAGNITDGSYWETMILTKLHGIGIKQLLFLHYKLGKWLNCVCASMLIDFGLATSLCSHELFQHGQWFRPHLPIHRQSMHLFHHFRIWWRNEHRQIPRVWQCSRRNSWVETSQELWRIAL